MKDDAHDDSWADMTPEQRECQTRITQEHDEHRRFTCNLFRFWRICRNKTCRRAASCVCNQHACFQRHWRLFPEQTKIHIRAVIKAMAAGLTPEQAMRAGDAAVARHAELMAKLAAPPPAAASQHEAAAQAREEPCGPRIRCM